MKKLVIVTTFILSASLSAANLPKEQIISSITTEEISSLEFDYLNGRTEGGTQSGAHGKTMYGLSQIVQSNDPAPRPTINDRVDTAGRVISTVKEIVVLGEAIYDLVNKGRPTNVTEYAPISVVPRDPSVPRDPTGKEVAYIDPFEMEGFSLPVEKNFVTKIRDGGLKEVVNFTYKVVYSYGGSYNGAGKYLTSVIIVPGSVKTTYGWQFNASMKFGGIMNHGTKADPIAGILLAVKYQMNGTKTAFEKNETIHITGDGQLKNLNR